MATSAHTRQVVRAFHAARTAGDHATALEMLDPSFSFESPLLRLDERAIYLESHIQFQRLVTDLRWISELYGADEATLVYDLHTATPAGVQRTAEHFKLKSGRIQSILLIFDASPWSQAGSC